MKKRDYVISAILAVIGITAMLGGEVAGGAIFVVAAVVFFLYRKRRGSAPVAKAAVRSLTENEPLPVVMGSGVLLSAGETCHYYGSATLITIKNRVVGYSGGSSGVSFRVAKGVSYRVGQRKSAPVRQDVQEKSGGFLTVTSKRIVFTSRESFDKKISALSSVTPLDDGIVLQFGEKQYILETNDGPYINQIVSRIASQTEA